MVHDNKDNKTTAIPKENSSGKALKRLITKAITFMSFLGIMAISCLYQAKQDEQVFAHQAYAKSVKRSGARHKPSPKIHADKVTNMRNSARKSHPLTIKHVIIAAVVAIMVLYVISIRWKYYKYAHDNLHEAAMQGNLERVQYLCENGANVKAKDNWGRTALMWAAEEGHLVCVEYLCKNGADIEAKAMWKGETALMKATIKGHLDCVKCLCENGADVNVKDENGWTALMLADLYGKSDCIEYLSNYKSK